MRILCDRCREKTVDFDCRETWEHIETSKKGCGKTGDYYLCPACSDDFYPMCRKTPSFSYGECQLEELKVQRAALCRLLALEDNDFDQVILQWKIKQTQQHIERLETILYGQSSTADH